jgi:hypothetical protein
VILKNPNQWFVNFELKDIQLSVGFHFVQPNTLNLRGSIPILQKYQAIRNRSYTNKACLRRLDVLVRADSLIGVNKQQPIPC